MIIRLSGEVTSYDSVVMCAMVDINATDYDMILPTSVVSKLRSMPVVTVASLKVVDSEVIVHNEGKDLDSELNDEGNVVTNDDRGDVLCFDSVRDNDDDKSYTKHNRGHSCRSCCHVISSCTNYCLLYTSPSPRDGLLSRMPSSA